MSCLLLPRRFYNQPQGAVRVDWGNPLAQGLVSVFLPGNNYDLVSKSPFTGANHTLSAHRLGVAARCAQSIPARNFTRMTLMALVDVTSASNWQSVIQNWHIDNSFLALGIKTSGTVPYFEIRNSGMSQLRIDGTSSLI
jgi:hypothetical protein